MAAKTHTQTIFTVAHTDIGGMPFNNHGRTLRLVVPVNIPVTALRVRFSNRCGEAPLRVGAASLAACNTQGELLSGTLVPLTVDGTLDFTLPAGCDVWSDAVDFRLAAGDCFALNLYYPAAEQVVSGNWLGRSALRSRPGNFSADLCFSGPGILSRLARTVTITDMTVTITTVSQIDAQSPARGRVVACFGDSVTQQSNWTVPLEKRLHRRWPGEVSLCNLGISGNKLLRPSPPDVGGLYGQAGVDRFEHDLLGVSGLTHAILALGANDIIHPGSHGMPEAELVSLGEYSAAMEILARRLRGRGVRVYAATITPRTLGGVYDENRELLRQRLNGWIRTAACFDAVLDFDAVLARTDGRPGMRNGYALPDGIHPSPYGGFRMAKSINLGLFGEVE